MNQTEDTRDKIRLLQDKILELCKQKNLPDTLRLSINLPATITIASLKNVIYPEYENGLNEILDFLSNS